MKNSLLNLLLIYVFTERKKLSRRRLLCMTQLSLISLLLCACAGGGGGGGSVQLSEKDTDLQIKYKEVDVFNKKDNTQEQTVAKTEVLLSGLSAPVAMQMQDNKLYVVEQNGVIKSFVQGDQGWSLESSKSVPGVDFEEGLFDSAYRAQGVMGVAVSPKDPQKFFLHVVDADGIKDGEFSKVNVNIYQFDAESEPDVEAKPQEPLLKVEDNAYHNGGPLLIHEGYLYIAIGDGDTPFPTGDELQSWYASNPTQSPDNHEGSIIRVKLEDIDSEKPNFEVIAYGLRNPWGLSVLDNDTLVIADVGWDYSEEVNFLELGQIPQNFGWPIYEGGYVVTDLLADNPAYEQYSQLAINQSYSVSQNELTPPVYQYTHQDGLGSVVGGPVMTLNNEENYFFGDYNLGGVFYLPLGEDNKPEKTVQLVDDEKQAIAIPALVSLSSDNNDGLYALSYSEGKLYHITFPEPSPPLSIGSSVNGVRDLDTDSPTDIEIMIVTLPESGVLLPEQTFTVTAQGMKYFINDTEKASITLSQPGVYYFDQSDNTNITHPLGFSLTDNGTFGGGDLLRSDVDEFSITYDFNEKNDRIIITEDQEDFHYYCRFHTNMGSSIKVNITESGVSVGDVFSDISQLAYYNPNQGNYQDSLEYQWRVDSDDQWSDIITLSF